MDELKEKFAAIQHAIWAHWMKYLFSVSPGGEISYKNHNLWMHQINTPYEDLSEKEKQSDRDQVDRYWPLIEELTRAKNTYDISLKSYCKEMSELEEKNKKLLRVCDIVAGGLVRESGDHEVYCDISFRKDRIDKILKECKA